MKFGKQSTRNLAMLHFDLQWLCREVLNAEIMDFAVAQTYRDKETQDRYYREGKSKVPWPQGKHNKNPSEAMDIYPYINGKISYLKAHCCVLAGLFLMAAAKLGIKIRWGGNWDMDQEPITDQDFQDLGHFELVED